MALWAICLDGCEEPMSWTDSSTDPANAWPFGTLTEVTTPLTYSPISKFIGWADPLTVTYDAPSMTSFEAWPFEDQTNVVPDLVRPTKGTFVNSCDGGGGSARPSSGFLYPRRS